MSYTVIKAKCLDQALQLVNVPKIASGGVNEIRLEFEFCPLWDGLAKTAVFHRGSHAYRVLLAEDACVVPAEVLAEPGRLFFGVAGVGGDEVRTTELVMLPVEQGPNIDGAMDPVEPTPDVYQQILTELERVGAVAESADTRAAEAEANAADAKATADGVMDTAAQGVSAAAAAQATADEAKAAGVAVYTHSKTGTVHELTGTGSNGKALVTADVAEGDTVTVNGVAVPAYVGADNFADALAGQALTGRWVTFVFDGDQVNFKGGGGKVTTEGLTAESIISGHAVTIKQGAQVVAEVVGSCPPGGFFAWMDSGHTTPQVTAGATPLYTVDGAAVTFLQDCTVALVVGMATFTSANTTTSFYSRFTKNGEAACTATATGTGQVTKCATSTAAISVTAGDVVAFEATYGYPNNQMGFGSLTVTG